MNSTKCFTVWADRSRTRDGPDGSAWNRQSCLFVGDDKAGRASDTAEMFGGSVMQQQNAVLTGTLMIGVLLSSHALAQVGGNSGSGGSATGSRTTTGIVSDQPRIPPPGTNSLGTANSSGVTGSGTVGANVEPADSRRIDAEIQNENSRIDSKINGICRGC
jgi:hypothetical protein